MAKRKPRKPPSRSHKDPLLEAAVELAMVRGTFKRDARQLTEDHDCALSTVRRYQTEIRKRWASEETEARPKRRERFRAMLMEAWRIAITAEPRQMAPVLALMSKFEGFDQPVKIEVNHSVDIRSMSPRQRQDEIARLIAKRAASLDGRQAGALALPEPGDTTH